MWHSGKTPPLDGHGSHCDRRRVPLSADGQYGTARAPDVRRRGLDGHQATRQVETEVALCRQFHQADATIADTLPASARRYACLSLRSKSGCPSGQGLLLCRG
jgi:hypothetical protein